MSLKPATISARRFLPRLVQVVFLQQQLDRPREARQCAEHLVEAFLDALGDGDFAFARQQLDRAHLAHVHAHGVGGAAAFGIERGQRGRGFFGGGVVDFAAAAGGTGEQEQQLRLDASLIAMMSSICCTSMPR
jgi:hypothetical protein